ncbi:MAG: bifunctional metallophosphatase/5'-nucleotidase [Cyanosarcina radialis HA8281-LM2]|jgi:5'-nucleotidase|nr:bifunctional metallophosphatase/5'-nucleotidase [Cyanosarcina radialis HA8281-LM2]
MKSISNPCHLALQILLVSFASPALAENVNITFLQLNDVYEITPVSGGSSGGLARVATLKQQLKRQNPRTYALLAGDFFSPSALGTAKVDGKPLAGQQMVAVLNAMGLDFATFGNHEFDIPEDSFYQRLKESQFKWVSSNVFDAKGQPFPKIPQSQIINIKGDRGAVVRVGLIGLTIDSNRRSYVSYRDPIEVAKEQVKLLKNKVDITIAITHLAITQDRELAESVPEIDAIFGGHEHENIQQWRGQDFTPIFKADANARTVYIHNLLYDTKTRRLKIDSRLQPITNEIADGPNTAKVVKQWVEKGFQAFRADGFAPERVVATTSVILDGLEASVRNRSTNLTDLIANSMFKEVPNADLAVFNGGSIRIDDAIPPGPITQYDVIRILPFGGKVLAVDLDGKILERVLNQGQANRGTGGYLQTANVSQDPTTKKWIIAGKPLDPNRSYRIATSDFLVSGREVGLDFLKLGQPGIKLVAEKRDVRFAVIDELKRAR